MNRVFLVASLVSALSFAQSVEVKSKGKSVKVNAASATVETTKDGKKAKVELKADADAEDSDKDEAPAGAWEVSDASQTVTHDCKAGEAISITGASNTVTLTGPCGVVDVSGANNTVAIAQVDAISATGASNKITWKAGPKGKTPKISSTGVNNAISKK